ncbi:ferric-chelate reductase 1-like [Limulus polyphemus]|uniref:Ferric-chelate reductase 1-like n=1 Tax=Limulus polyphemus TaxID=6850 RepID=A0ABM1C626_LIMPO|nr:ferric-chelate reductase 1-like [Limulus polyphemus]
MRLMYLLAVLVYVFVPTVYGYPSGAPIEACESLTPRHGKNQPQPSRYSPFKITQSTDQYAPGDVVTVKIRGSRDHSFSGFFVKAYDPATGAPIGKFQDGKGLKIYNSETCSGATHSDNVRKRGAVLVWEAPQSKGRVAFKVTVLKRFSEFYTNLEPSLE